MAKREIIKDTHRGLRYEDGAHPALLRLRERGRNANARLYLNSNNETQTTSKSEE